jgi:hypothetical protein
MFINPDHFEKWSGLGHEVGYESPHFPKSEGAALQSASALRGRSGADMV